MKTRAIKTGFAISALAIAVSPAMAAELRFDGFASFVAGQVLDKDELTADGFRGFDEKLGFQNNSIFALQVRADLMEKLSATAQVTAKGSEDYNAEFNWAYLSYEINNEWTVKVGRSRIPYFMYSDFLDVGYAYHWISPPDSVYNLGGFDSADGVTLEYQTDIGSWTSRLSLMAGRSETTLASATGGDESDVSISELGLIAWSMNYNWLTLRAVYSASELSLQSGELSGLETGLGAFGVTTSAINQFSITDDPAEFAGVGFSIDKGNFLLIGEYTELTLKDSFLSDPSKQWYVSAGYRFGDYTAYVTYENLEADANTSGRDEIIGQLDAVAPFIPAPAQDAFNQVYGGTLAAFNQTQADEDTYSVGLRYNFHPSAAAKIEYTMQDNKEADLEPQLIAVAIDLVY